MDLDHRTVETVGGILAVALLIVLTHFRDKRKERSQAEVLTGLFSSMKDSNAAAFTELKNGISEVRHICVGHDGENGLRGDIRRVEGKVDGLETRERERLQDAALHGNPDRRRRKA